MQNLHDAGRSNMISGLVSCVGVSDDLGNKSRLPLDRMPTGYLEYQILFYNSSHKATVCACQFSAQTIPSSNLGAIVSKGLLLLD